MDTVPKTHHQNKGRFFLLGIGTASFFLMALGLACLAFAGKYLIDLRVLPAVLLAIPGIYLCNWAVELFRYGRRPPEPDLFAPMSWANRIISGLVWISLGLMGLCVVFGVPDSILLPLLPTFLVVLYQSRLRHVEPLQLPLFEPFIRVETNGNISCYHSLDSLTQAIEPTDVRNESFKVFDCTGSLVELRIEREKVQQSGGEIWSERVNPVPAKENPNPDELHAALRQALAGIPGLAVDSLSRLELMVAACKHFGLK